MFSPLIHHLLNSLFIINIKHQITSVFLYNPNILQFIFPLCDALEHVSHIVSKKKYKKQLIPN